jgi:NADH-quinone oxidoreductase subunit E
MSPKKTNPETMSVFSPKLAARFDALVLKYPAKRSALIPMLLYAQDEIGYLSDAVIAEVAHRIGITELEVRNVATYYSMLRFKPAGKFNIQVCTNISCMLRGAYDVYERFQEELGIGPKGVTPDGLFSLEEVECIGACCWAPAIQVNYEFHNELKPELVPGILGGYRGKAGAPSDESSSLGWKAGAPSDESSSLGWKAGAPSDGKANAEGKAPDA